MPLSIVNLPPASSASSNIGWPSVMPAAHATVGNTLCVPSVVLPSDSVHAGRLTWVDVQVSQSA